MTTPRGISELRIWGSRYRCGALAARRRNPATGGRFRKNSARALPRLELLEDRMMLASFLVYSNADTNTLGTLRYAINHVNRSSDSSNIITSTLR